MHLGVIGDGQLGGFLCIAASSLEIETSMLSSSAEGVAAKFANHVIKADFADTNAIAQLIHSCDAITFELEDVPVATLQQLQQAQQAGLVQVFPRPETMMLLQNKGFQKDWLVAQGFPTSPHLRFDQDLDAQACLDKFGPKFVIKTQRGGYDGLGVKLVKEGNVPDDYQSVPTIAEGAVEDFIEIAALVARDEKGQCVAFPLFESIFDDAGNVVRRVTCPADVSATVQDQATQMGCDIVTALDGVGIFAIEYFLTEDKLLVNEIAPRVHNVGHLTIEAGAVSQFEQHVRAVCGLPLVSPATVQPAVMENLLYEEAIAQACVEETELPQVQGVGVHWYGKSQPRPLRKMGHLTAIADSVADAAQLADKSIDLLQQQG